MVTSILGTNSYLMSRELAGRVEAFIREHGDLAYERLDAEGLTLDRLMEAIQSLPFLAAQKLVVVRDLGQQKILAENLEKILAAVPESTELILYESKVDKRLTYYKSLKKLTACQEYGELDERGLAEWLVGEASAANGTLSRNDAQYLVERVGSKQLMLSHELEKLLLYEPHITRATIDHLVEPSPQSSIFEMLDTIFRGEVQQGMKRYRELRAQGEEPQKILAMIGWQLHILIVVKLAGTRSIEQVAQEAKLSPFVLRKAQGSSRRLTASRIKELIRQSADLDMKLKSEPVDPDQAVMTLLVKIANS